VVLTTILLGEGILMADLAQTCLAKILAEDVGEKWITSMRRVFAAGILHYGTERSWIDIANRVRSVSPIKVRLLFVVGIAMGHMNRDFAC
jgi:threonine/homoserine efflux transporter RhtA